jgi:hypothetical protein
MSIKLLLSEKAKESQRIAKERQGLTDGASPQSAAVVEEYCTKIYEVAESGEESYFFDMKDYNQATITKVSIDMKTKLGDVLVIVSPRGIEANWKMSD